MITHRENIVTLHVELRAQASLKIIKKLSKKKTKKQQQQTNKQNKTKTKQRNTYTH